MKMFKQPSWQHEITAFEGNAILWGIKIFEYDWQHTGNKVIVEDPLYHEQHSFNIYSVVVHGETKQFAAGEFSNGVWGFYLLKY